MAQTPEERRESSKLRARKYRKNHPERTPEIRRRHYLNHQDAILATRKAKWAENLEASRAKTNAYYAANAERARAKSKKWRLAHLEKAKSIVKNYRQTHPDVTIQHREAYRARKNKAPVNDLTPKQWEEIKSAFGHRCAYCHKKMKCLTKDHIVPLIKGGGTYHIQYYSCL